jgi:hypothetical protein
MAAMKSVISDSMAAQASLVVFIWCKKFLPTGLTSLRMSLIFFLWIDVPVREMRV